MVRALAAIAGSLVGRWGRLPAPGSLRGIRIAATCWENRLRDERRSFPISLVNEQRLLVDAVQHNATGLYKLSAIYAPYEAARHALLPNLSRVKPADRYAIVRKAE